MTLKSLVEKGIEMDIEIEQLLKDHERLVQSIAARMYTPNGVFSIEDLVQVGLLSLWRNGSKYNSKRGKISTFITHCVRNDILKFINNQKLTTPNKPEMLRRSQLFNSDELSYRDETLNEAYDFADYLGLRNDLEKEVISLKLDGHNYSQIAKRVGIHPNKVSTIVNNIAERARSKDE
ncbi:MAG: sigma-70 family RNA polymerase sigma factor [Candidatus Bathyarchaeota archaeon]|nr:sigma-70 family RNA polymerase sigma factor [Candidatus Bathyarchaeota archaeon]